MICTCHGCDKPFWRYRRDYPPHGFCSIPCAAAGPIKEKPNAPEFPEVILRAMRAHRVFEHETDSMLAVFDCRRCEELEEQYAESLTFHYDRISADIAAQSRAI